MLLALTSSWAFSLHGVVLPVGGWQSLDGVVLALASSWAFLLDGVVLAGSR